MWIKNGIGYLDFWKKFRFLKFKSNFTFKMMGSKVTITSQETDHGVMIHITKNLLMLCSVSIRKAKSTLSIIRKG